MLRLTPDEKESERRYWENKLVKNCPLCHGTGWKESPKGLIECGCHKRMNVYTEMVNNGFGKAYLNYDFTTGTNTAFNQACLAYFKKFPSYYDEGIGLFLFGNHGRGKTVMETVIAKEVMLRMNPNNQNNFNMKFFLYDDLVRLSYSSSNERELENIIKHTSLLVLDNIGSETGLNTANKSSVNLLENILRNRSMMLKPTFMSTNFDMEDLPSMYSQVIFDLIRNKFKIIFADGKDIRKDEADKLNG